MLYNGWTPSEAMIKRMEESRLQNDFRHKLLELTTEIEVDMVHGLIITAEAMDTLPAEWSDPRTGEQADIDRWQDETEATRKTDRPY